LIVFLHGGGERGDDPRLLTAQPLPETLAARTSFPAIVFSPQLPLRFAFWTDLIEPVDALVGRLARRYAIDPRRLYLTGLSTGGFGTWEYGVRHPRRFAALVPIAGGFPGTSGVPRGICVLRKVPIWAFHGAADPIVPEWATLSLEGRENVTRRVYPGLRHETHNEPSGPAVIDDTIAWINAAIMADRARASD
jgi:predicted peptidase